VRFWTHLPVNHCPTMTQGMTWPSGRAMRENRRMQTNARTLLCAVPQPVGNAPKRYSLKDRLTLRLLATLGLVAGFQVATVGPAAVATLPSALSARPFAVAALDPTVGFKP